MVVDVASGHSLHLACAMFTAELNYNLTTGTFQPVVAAVLENWALCATKCFYCTLAGGSVMTCSAQDGHHRDQTDRSNRTFHPLCAATCSKVAAPYGRFRFCHMSVNARNYNKQATGAGAGGDGGSQLHTVRLCLCDDHALNANNKTFTQMKTQWLRAAQQVSRSTMSTTAATARNIQNLIAIQQNQADMTDSDDSRATSPQQQQQPLQQQQPIASSVIHTAAAASTASPPPPPQQQLESRLESQVQPHVSHDLVQAQLGQFSAMVSQRDQQIAELSAHVTTVQSELVTMTTERDTHLATVMILANQVQQLQLYITGTMAPRVAQLEASNTELTNKFNGAVHSNKQLIDAYQATHAALTQRDQFIAQMAAVSQPFQQQQLQRPLPQQ